jgi:hypothetical protein
MIASLATSAPAQFLDIGGTRFAYRRFGTPSGTALVFTRHFMGNRAAAQGVGLSTRGPAREDPR